MMLKVVALVGRRWPCRLFRDPTVLRVVITRVFLHRSCHRGRGTVSHRKLLLTLGLINGCHQHLMTVDHPDGLLGGHHLLVIIGRLLLLRLLLWMLVSHELSEWGLAGDGRYLIICCDTFSILLDQVLGGNLNYLLSQFLLLLGAFSIGGQVEVHVHSDVVVYGLELGGRGRLWSSLTTRSLLSVLEKDRLRSWRHLNRGRCRLLPIILVVRVGTLHRGAHHTEKTAICTSYIIVTSYKLLATLMRCSLVLLERLFSMLLVEISRIFPSLVSI